MLKITTYSQWLLSILVLIMIGMLAGCGSEVADDWDPLSAEQARHPFDDRDEHGEYLATVDFDFSECTVCHGETLRGVELGDPNDPVRDCTICHSADNHSIYFDNAFEHAQWLSDNEYSMEGCFVCHKSSENADLEPVVEFGTTCGSTGSCHDPDLGPLACNTCHGEMDEDPSILENQAPDMGAHTAHLTTAGTYATFTCEICHIQPMQAEDEGHYNDDTPGMVEINFSVPANAGGFDPEWSGGTATCSNVYCHFANDMDWNAQNAEPDCVFCHSYPPEEGHSALNDCVLCHSSVVGPDGDDPDDYVDILEDHLHINGSIDFNN